MLRKCRSARRRGLGRNDGQSAIDAGPAWCLGGPNRRRRPRDFAIVERSGAHENEVGSSLRRAENLRAALGAEAPVHGIAAVSHAWEVAKLAFDAHRRALKTYVDRATARPKILAEPAPTHPRDDGGCGNTIANGAAQAAAGNIHGASL